MSVQPRPHLRALFRAVHGGVSPRELHGLGLDPRQVMDFSMNTNPYGPPPGVMEAWRGADVSRYPDPEAWQLREALAQELGVALGQVLVGNGSVELLWLTALGYLEPGNRVLVLGPTFGEYQVVAQIAGAQMYPVLADPQRAFVPDLAAVYRALAIYQPRAVFVCNPNNPTGVFLASEGLRELAGAHLDTLFVVDEAYLPFLAEGASSIDGGLLENMVTLRSMTKDCAIPGLRLGYAVAPEAVLEVLGAVQPPWSVSAPAQAAGLAALQEKEHLRRSLRLLDDDKAYLASALAALGVEVCPSAASFFLVKVGCGADFRQALLQEGCCVRDCASFGLPEYVRIGVRTRPECQRLVSAVAEVLAKGRALE